MAEHLAGQATALATVQRALDQATGPLNPSERIILERLRAALHAAERAGEAAGFPEGMSLADIIRQQQERLATVQRELEEARRANADWLRDITEEIAAKDAAEARCAALIDQLGGFALDLLAEADVSDATGDFCCAQIRRDDADRIATLLGTRKG